MMTHPADASRLFEDAGFFKSFLVVLILLIITNIIERIRRSRFYMTTDALGNSL